MSQSILAKGKNGQFQLTITLPQTKVKEQWEKLIKKAAAEVEMPGFRKGKAPLEKAEEKLDKSKIYDQVLQKLLSEAYLIAINEYQLKPVMDPQLEVLTVDLDKDWQVRATAAEKPDVKLGAYKEGLKGLLNSTEIWTPESAKQNKEDLKNKSVEGQKSELSPEEKRQHQVVSITNWLLQNVEVEPAEGLVQQQANNLLARLLDQIQQLGITLEQYIGSTGKKLEDLKAEYAQRAMQDLKLEFLMLEIANQEKITVGDADIDKLISETDDEKTRTALQDSGQRQHLKAILTRQKLIEHLIKISS